MEAANRDIAEYLLARRLVSAQDVVRGRLTIRSTPSRHENFVATSARRAYFIKRATDGDRAETLAREAATVRLLRTSPELARFVPRLISWDARGSTLASELTDGPTVSMLPARSRRSKALARQIGRALGRLHSADLTRRRHAASPPPWAARLHSFELSWMHDMSAANLELVRLIQASELPPLLDELASGWHRDAVVHGDFKWANCVVTRARAGSRLRIVDWELGGVGDPAWDLGSAFGEYLTAWLFSIPITGQDPPARFPELAREPLESFRPSLGELWTAYRTARGLQGVEANRMLARSVSLAAVRLLQSAFEWTQHTAELPGTAVCLLQVAENVAKRPHEAAVRLFGLEFCAP